MPVRRIQFSIVLATMALLAFFLPQLSSPASIQAAAPPAAATLPAALQVLADEAPAPATPVADAGAAVLVAPVETTALPSLEDFAASFSGGDPAEVAGVYVDGVLAMRIVSQPEGDFNFIDPAAGVATRYGIAADAGAIGLLAHNYSGGAVFSQLENGQTAYLVQADGSTAPYNIELVQRYQAVSPTDPFSYFVDLLSGETLDSSQVFARNFLSGKLVFQTCIEKDGDWSWGRLFVIASPIT